jgi:thioredoxin-related protein
LPKQATEFLLPIILTVAACKYLWVNFTSMKTAIFLLAIVMLSAVNIFAQEKILYNPAANAATDIAAAVKRAAAENKFVVLQAGGNWCRWCIEFANFCKADPQIDSTLKSSFVWYDLNYSKENTNDALFAKYGFPQRFGFPVFIILDGKGQRLHTQNSEYLEDGKKSYDRKKVLNFFEQWSPKALAPKTYSQ